MSDLDDAHQALTDHLRQHVNADPIAAVVPAIPTAWGGYVWPANDWIIADEDGTFCARFDVSLVCDFVAATLDLEHSQKWLNERVYETLVCAANGIEVLPDVTVDVVSAQIVGIVRTDQGSEMLVARVVFSPFELEVS